MAIIIISNPQLKTALSAVFIAVASYARTKIKLRRELRRFAPQLSSEFYVLTYLAIAIIFHQPQVPTSPLNGPTISEVIQPP